MKIITAILVVIAVSSLVGTCAHVYDATKSTDDGVNVPSDMLTLLNKQGTHYVYTDDGKEHQTSWSSTSSSSVTIYFWTEYSITGHYLRADHMSSTWNYQQNGTLSSREYIDLNHIVSFK